MCLMSYANNKGADQHPRSLISAFVVRCLGSIISLFSIAEISRLQLASVAAQAGLCLAWSSVGNHVIFVMIHCTERWRRFAPDRILSKGKQHFLSIFSVFIQRVIYHFPTHIYPDLMIPGYCQKDPYFQQRLCHKIWCGEDRDWNTGIICTDGK